MSENTLDSSQYGYDWRKRCRGLQRIAFMASWCRKVTKLKPFLTKRSCALHRSFAFRLLLSNRDDKRFMINPDCYSTFLTFGVGLRPVAHGSSTCQQASSSYFITCTGRSVLIRGSLMLDLFSQSEKFNQWVVASSAEFANRMSFGVGQKRWAAIL